ncbi:septal ring lytic transglycosylase RlpA family protein [Bradyrhizobium sp. LA2.1]|uniref:septal ring lytic transglycosylase RlpA family protein n=1 Tax=Bradyrhizobium sp. LA2.1 TaxID=3156376 RepID=UPI00339B1B4B
MKAAASGTTFDRDSLTAAHRNLPLGTHVRVTDPKSSKSVVVRITDRGPWIRSRVIDLSLAAARSLGFTNRGVAQVVLRCCNRRPLPSENTQARGL